MTDQQTVLTTYPDAVIRMNLDNGRYKLWKDSQTWIALSASHDDQALCWQEAAQEIQRRKES